MRSHLLLVASFATTLAVAAFGFANPPASPPPPAAKAGTGGAPAPVGSASSSPRGDVKAKPAAGAILKGHAAYMARDYPGAVVAYKEATAADGSDPAGYYFLGEAQIAIGSTADADASFATGLRNASNNDSFRGKLLFVIADLRERQGKWPEAKKAWEEYAQFLATHPNAKGYAATATERVKVVDARADLDAKYAPVKQRIEQRLKENVSIPNALDESSASSPAKKK